MLLCCRGNGRAQLLSLRLSCGARKSGGSTPWFAAAQGSESDDRLSVAARAASRWARDLGNGIMSSPRARGDRRYRTQSWSGSTPCCGLYS